MHRHRELLPACWPRLAQPAHSDSIPSEPGPLRPTLIRTHTTDTHKSKSYRDIFSIEDPSYQMTVVCHGGKN